MKTFNKQSTPIIDRIAMALDKKEEERLSPVAVLNSKGIRRVKEELLDMGYRQSFSVDADRILHSLAYARYIDKTQVFYLIKNDHITHRVLHVQMVSKIARTIGRFLGLNEDLIEAIALGHDIGHPPFGHDGEKILSKICRKYGIGYFLHNIQSVQFLDRVERKGKGWNLCLQTLDGILCHDGEIHNQKLRPQREKTFHSFEEEILEKKNNPDKKLMPMTLEGCLVRMTDTISYIGRDIEDAIRLGIIQRQDIPNACVKVLGDTNGTIVFNLVTDIINHSFQNVYITFSPEISDALRKLKRFNLEHIYLNPHVKKNLNTIKNLYEIMFDQYLTDIDRETHDSAVFTGFLNGMSEAYTQTHSHAEIVRDFIAGMTDQYFLRQCPENMRPKHMVM